jgi:hypothetical protein
MSKAFHASIVVALVASMVPGGCAAAEDEGYRDAAPSDPAADMDDLSEQPGQDDNGTDGSEPPFPDGGDVQDIPADDGAWDVTPDVPADADESSDGLDSLDGLDASDFPVDTPPDPPDAPDAADIVPDDIPAEEAPGEVWVEASYRYRSTSESPETADWSFSPTPSWTASNWGTSSSTWPYINAPDGGSLVSDPIGGTVLELGCYDRFRLFFGLEELSHVGRATVTLEGRSRDTSAGVDFEVWNPLLSGRLASQGVRIKDNTVKRGSA